MARLVIQLLGPFQVTLDGKSVTTFKSNKVRALLSYLSTEVEHSHLREALAELLWPDWPEHEAMLLTYQQGEAMTASQAVDFCLLHYSQI